MDLPLNKTEEFISNQRGGGRISGCREAGAARAAIIAFSFVLSICTTRTGAAEGPPHAAPRVLADFALAKGDSPWVARATIRYNEYRMLIDTGCATTLFDLAHRDALGKLIGTVNINSANGMVPVKGLERRRSPVLEIGELKVRPRAGVVCIDLGFLAKCTGTKIDGILGMDVLRQVVFNVDPDEGRLRFYSAVDREAGRRISVFWDNSPGLNGNPLVEVAFGDGAPRRVVIDSGNNGGPGASAGALNSKLYDELASKGLIFSLPVAATTKTHTLGGPAAIDKWAKTLQMSLGEHAHEGLIFSFDRGPSALGLGYLSRYCITFDFGHDAIYLRPSKQFRRGDFYDLSGMKFVKEDDAAAVTVVFKDGPAGAAGLAPGDSITAIDGQTLGGLNEAAVHEFFLKDGRHSIDFRRGNALSRAVLVIRSTVAASPAGKSPPSDK